MKKNFFILTILYVLNLITLPATSAQIQPIQETDISVLSSTLTPVSVLLQKPKTPRTAAQKALLTGKVIMNGISIILGGIFSIAFFIEPDANPKTNLYAHVTAIIFITGGINNIIKDFKEHAVNSKNISTKKQKVFFAKDLTFTSLLALLALTRIYLFRDEKDAKTQNLLGSLLVIGALFLDSAYHTFKSYKALKQPSTKD